MQSPLPVDGPTNPKAKAIFARRILPGMVALLVAAIVAAAFAVVHIARKIDRRVAAGGLCLEDGDHG